jgi:hypothetical protein
MNKEIKISRAGFEPAYFTLEASLVFPFAMLFTVMMIFLAFYAYDRCVLEHSAYQAALIGASNHFEDSGEALEMSKEAAALLADKRIFAAREFKYDVSVEGKSVKVTYHCTVNMPFKPWLSRYTGGISDDKMTLGISKSAKRIRPARLIRTCRVLNDIGNKLKE